MAWGLALCFLPRPRPLPAAFPLAFRPLGAPHGLALWPMPYARALAQICQLMLCY